MGPNKGRGGPDSLPLISALLRPVKVPVQGALMLGFPGGSTEKGGLRLEDKGAL